MPQYVWVLRFYMYLIFECCVYLCCQISISLFKHFHCSVFSPFLSAAAFLLLLLLVFFHIESDRESLVVESLNIHFIIVNSVFAAKYTQIPWRGIQFAVVQLRLLFDISKHTNIDKYLFHIYIDLCIVYQWITRRIFAAKVSIFDVYPKNMIVVNECHHFIWRHSARWNIRQPQKFR